MLSFPPPAAKIPILPTGSEFSVLYRSAGDQSKHRSVIERLAVELGRTVADIAPLYEEVLMGMRNQAQIQDYLPILVSKRVKQLLGR